MASNNILVLSTFAKNVLTKNGFMFLKVDTFYIHNVNWGGCNCCPCYIEKRGYVFKNTENLSARKIKKLYGIICNIVKNRD